MVGKVVDDLEIVHPVAGVHREKVPDKMTQFQMTMTQFLKTRISLCKLCSVVRVGLSCVSCVYCVYC